MQRPRAIAPLFVAGIAVLAAGAALLSAQPPPAASTANKEAEPKSGEGGKKAAIGRKHAGDAEAHVRLPRWWKAGDPVPVVKSNCVRCHLTAGRELTAPAQDFARSVHDLHGMTCSDCHGGNRDDDESAHEEKVGFIGTKLSAHMAGCAECHGEQAEAVKSGPHYWDFSKHVNLKYPVCSDCHGHHDVEKPPVEFSLKTVCRECHLNFEHDMPTLAEVVIENDRLWGTIRKVQDRNLKNEQPVPEQFHHDLEAARHLTATLIHPAHKISAQQAEELNTQVKAARGRLEQWLAQDAAHSPTNHASDARAPKPAASKTPTPTPTDRSKNAP
jgi:Cytochrome c3